MVVTYIGIGSNLDDPVQQVLSALVDIALIKESQLLKQSSLYRSPPMGRQDQPDYINAVVSLQTTLNPANLLTELQAIENNHGRKRVEHWGPRTLDLDILLFDQKMISLPTLKIPHPGLYERNFVLYPLLEIEPQLHIPALGPILQLVAQCPQGSLQRIEQV